ncbi:pre-toxin TG domain-containing protein, partial [Aerococcaceae bacterium NML191292]|nr:pre-toxin TG domain-containing protein [Aerococcaceae bacterium NML191292]
MTKNVALYTSTWHKMKSALSSLTGGGSHYGGYGGYGGYNGTSSQGFSKDIDKLVSISESAKRLITEKDSDGVVSFRYHDERQTAQGLQGKLEALEKYSNHVSTYLKDKIDSPFYQAMDGVGAKLEALSIASYKTSNTIGYKRTDVLTDVYGHQLGTREVTPQEIGLEELYRVDNPYKKTLQASYQDFKNSAAYKDHQLTETEFLMASHHTRAFNYESIRDQQEAIEFWRDIALGVGVVVLTIFCPPAGVTVGVVLAGAEMYSAATGKDWGTGRELSDGERILRGSFALFDLIPGAKYLHTVAKSGSVVAAKGLLKTSLKEGFEQGARNFDTGMKLLSRFGDNVLRQVDNFGRQADQL